MIGKYLPSVGTFSVLFPFFDCADDEITLAILSNADVTSFAFEALITLSSLPAIFFKIL